MKLLTYCIAGALLSNLARGAEPMPAFQTLRYNEDYSALRDAQSADLLDEIKYIALDTDGAFLSFGGEIRERYEIYDHSLWGQGPQDDNGYLLQRYMLHGDLHFSEFIRVFVQLKSGLEDGRNGGPRPTDEDRLDFNQAFVDFSGGGNHVWTLTTRVGRQELLYGSSRLIAVRDGPNVQQSFDGLREILKFADWQVDFLVVEPVKTNTGTRLFDDGNDPNQRLWGSYAVTPVTFLPGGHVDLYYLGYLREHAQFDQGSGREERESVGTRLWGVVDGWDYNFEAVYQGGRFGSGAISAWTIASDTGYTWSGQPWHPRLGFKADVASGDRNPNGNTLGTFNAMFPRGAYFNESALIGPANIIDLHPSVALQPDSRFTITFDTDFYWRESTRDGIYGFAGNLIRSGKNVPGRKIGTQPSVTPEWRPSRNWSFYASYAYFFSGEFIRESGPGKNINYFTMWSVFRF